ncbi:MAG: hypothetical protein LBU32_20215 [Clostridiales bacterium]|jgi:hypothetical protein|nr:hypothetical protein [Clostridiales bacterium]
MGYLTNRTHEITNARKENGSADSSTPVETNGNAIKARKRKPANSLLSNSGSQALAALGRLQKYGVLQGWILFQKVDYMIPGRPVRK